MIIVVDDCDLVKDGFSSLLGQEGISSTGLSPSDCRGWLATASDPELMAVEAFLLGDCEERHALSRVIKGRSEAALIAMNIRRSLEDTLALFAAGADDVIGKPVHPREILARIGAIKRRTSSQPHVGEVGSIRVYFDGRDPEINDEPITLPRRERRILEYLVANKSRRVTKAQIFNSVYGLFDETIDENVVESHISKLRKKLRRRLGYDPVDSKRYLGYQIVQEAAPSTGPAGTNDRTPELACA